MRQSDRGAGLVMKQGARLGKSMHLDHTHSHACIEDGNTYLLMMKKWYLNWVIAKT
jgi:hypothetical protein